MRQQVANKLRNYSTQAREPRTGTHISSKFNDLQDALRTVGRSSDGKMRDITDVDSTLSRRGLMQRKLLLMKMMLKNEKNANTVMKQKIDSLGSNIHADNYTMRQLENQRQSRK